MERLQKVIAHAGITSRRKSRRIYFSWQRKVNGQAIKELGVKVTKNDVIEVDEVTNLSRRIWLLSIV